MTITLTYLISKYLIINDIKKKKKNIFYIIFYIFLLSILITFLINPGIPERKYYMNNYKIEEPKNYIECKICNIILPKEMNTGHCTYCNICIFKYDHHCQWIGKCIGKNNTISFIIFCISLLGYILMFFLCLFLFLYKQLEINPKDIEN